MDRGTVALCVSTIGLVPSVFGSCLPNMSEVRADHDEHGHLAASEHYAALVSGAMVVGIAGVTRSPEVLVAGLIAVVAFSSAYQHARRTTP